MAYGQILGQTQDTSQFVKKDEMSQYVTKQELNSLKNTGLFWTQIANWSGSGGVKTYPLSQIPYAFKFRITTTSLKNTPIELEIGSSSTLLLGEIYGATTASYFLPVIQTSYSSNYGNEMRILSLYEELQFYSIYYTLNASIRINLTSYPPFSIAYLYAAF